MKASVILVFTIITLVFCQCNNPADSIKPGKDGAITATTAAPVPETGNQLSGCYRATIGKDSAELQLNANGDIVDGSLIYNRFEKDDNKGNLIGTIENNIIKTWYTFQSEGTVSVKQVFYRIIDDKLEEGYGEMDLKHDTAVFRHPTALRYEANHPYLKVNCN